MRHKVLKSLTCQGGGTRVDDRHSLRQRRSAKADQQIEGLILLIETLLHCCQKIIADVCGIDCIPPRVRAHNPIGTDQRNTR